MLDSVRTLLSLVIATFFLLGCGEDDPADDAGGGGADASVQDGGGDVDAGPGMMSTMRPSKRSDIGGVADPTSGTIVTFGGDDGPIIGQRPMPRFLDDTWIYEPGFGWTEVVTDPHPSARGRYGATYDPNGRRMLLFGGRFRVEGGSGDYTLNNELWAFSFETQTWEMLHDGAGTAPGARYSPALAYDAATDTLYVAGGGLNANALRPEPAADLWSFDGTTWTEIPTSGDAPSSRLFEAWAHDPSRGSLISFGGQVGDFFSPAFSDMHALDLATGTWTQLDTGTGPEGRFNAMLEYDADNDRYLMFGGHADPGVTNDLWAWDATAGSWAELGAGDEFTGGGLGCLGNPQEIPEDYVTQDLAAPERRQGGVLRVMNGRLWLFAGESDCSDHLDDTWSFDLSTDAWMEHVEARSGETCARQGDDCMCLCL